MSGPRPPPGARGAAGLYFGLVPGTEAGSGLPGWSACLDGEERRRADRLARAEDRAGFAFAHALLRHALTHAAGLFYVAGADGPGGPGPLEPGAWVFAVPPGGKPRLADRCPQGRAFGCPGGMDFSLSHARGAALAGVLDGGRIGVDLEDAGRRADMEAMAERFFAPEERAAIRRADRPEELRLRFFKCWTLKEAYLKALGTGITRPLDSFAVGGLDGTPPRLLRDDAPGVPPPRRWRFGVFVVVLCFYCYLCGFAFPVMRASIMFLVLSANGLLFKRSDFLSLLSLAAILVLLVCPHALVSLSFQLSFACMLGLGLFRVPVNAWLRKIFHAPKEQCLVGLPFRDKLKHRVINFFIKGTTFYLCVTFTTFPLLVNTFGVMPVFGLFANVLLLPIIVLCFQGAVIATVTWVGLPLLYLANWGLQFVRAVVGFMGNLPFAQIYIASDGYWFLFWFVGIILLTRFVFLTKRVRYSAAALFIAVYVLSLLI